jgi:hypothetical protein
MRRIGAAAIVMLGLTAGVEARQEGLDVSKLPVNLERIQRGLRESATRDLSEGLDIRFVVSVVAPSPRLELLPEGFNFLTGPVPNSAPTHGEVVDYLTPKEFSAPVADFGALARWLAEKAKR